MKTFDLSPVGRARVWLGTVVGTLFCVAAAMLVDSVNFSTMSAEQFRHAMLVNTLLPTALAAPLLFGLLTKMRQLALTQKELTILAATDGLTEIYNRAAFKMLVDAYLERTRETGGGHGAFLVVDADHFKAINDEHGHDQGDEALRLIARAIKTALRHSDAAGRLGGEEFGIFLPGLNEPGARAIAERIRVSIKDASSEALAAHVEITVSIGGVMFCGKQTFDELFKAADRLLYKAKDAGRNVVMIAQLAMDEPDMAY